MRGINIRWIAWIAGIAAVLWLLRDLLSYLFAVILGGIAIAACISPLQKRLEQKMPRMASIIGAWLIILAAVFAAGIMFVPVIVKQATILCEAWPRFCRYLSLNLSLPDPAQWSAEEISGIIGRMIGIFARVGSSVGSVMNSFSRFGMMWIASIFLLREKERYLLMAELAIPFRWRKRILRIARRMQRELRLFLCAQAAVGLCVGVLAAMGLMLIGLRSGLLLGVITGIFNLIPYFGPVIAAIPVILVAWMDGWYRAALAGAVLIAVQQIDGFFISPKIMSGATGFSPLVVLLSISVGGSAFGVMGMVLAIPALIVFRILFTELVQNRLKYYG